MLGIYNKVSVLCAFLYDEVKNDICMLLYLSNVSAAFKKYFVRNSCIFGLFSEQDLFYLVKIFARYVSFLTEVTLTIVKEIEFIIKLNFVLVLTGQRRTFLDKLSILISEYLLRIIQQHLSWSKVSEARTSICSFQLSS